MKMFEKNVFVVTFFDKIKILHDANVPPCRRWQHKNPKEFSWSPLQVYSHTASKKLGSCLKRQLIYWKI